MKWTIDQKNLVIEAVARVGPARTRRILSDLSQRGVNANKSELNSLLYKMKDRGLLRQSADYEWSVVTQSPKGRAPQPQKRSEISRSTKANGGSPTVPFHPTPEQQRLVEFRPDGHLLIRGEAGSGKTTVLAARAGHLVSGDLIRGRLLFLAYNVALVEYAKKLLAEFKCSDDVDLYTLHGWASHFYRSMTGNDVDWAEERAKSNWIRQAKLEAQDRWAENHLANANDTFWKDELEWLFGQGIRSLEGYKHRPRKGRGTAVQVRGEDHDFVWEVYSRYRKQLKSVGKFDSHDLLEVFRTAAPKRDDGKRYFPENLQYDHVCIDEIQDCDLSWFPLIAPVAKRSLTLAGDLGQRIYRRSFTWKEAGVNVVGRSHSLAGSFRTTKQIMKVAVYLAQNDDVKGEDYVEPTIPDREGPPVHLIKRATHWEAREAAVSEAARLWGSRRNQRERVVVAAQFNKNAERLDKELKAASVPAKLEKGRNLASSGNHVTVTTFHQLKGLEFDDVIITGLEDETMPQFWIDKQQGSERPEEAEAYLRRLVYVAMTRAKRTVVLSGAEPFSRFFKDVPEELFKPI